ncbi:endolytic transglycosylase MltG [Haloimpatiens massiliensis]|uniref:endolytic transglycosylase MltG n=1 Tax=Haloimpatiens massiliensis TaxID=1658110 RepID=UPI000C85C39E|nr:endolytic transglycosylase MltG [Haloimpatiens massiliensis]
MKKRVLILLFTIIVLLTASISIINKKVKSPFKIKGDYSLKVENGDTFYKVLNRLSDENVIFNSKFIKVYLKGKKLNLTTKPGIYVVNKNTSLEEFISMLNKGNKEVEVQVTIPEGYTVEQIAELLEDKKLVKKVEFIKKCNEYQLPEYIKGKGNTKYPLEGYLFPDTYQFKKDASAEKIIDTMLKRTEKVLNGIEAETGLKVKDVENQVIIASLIEKEARVDGDRGKIASVIHNRLKKDMKLQIDATVLYALGKHKETVTIKDTKTESPYNTYYTKGLPLGPICSPGKESLVAAVKPENTDYLFYLYKKDASKEHYFTNNYEDFKKAMKKYGY